MLEQRSFKQERTWDVCVCVFKGGPFQAARKTANVGGFRYRDTNPNMCRMRGLDKFKDHPSPFHGVEPRLSIQHPPKVCFDSTWGFGLGRTRSMASIS